MKHIAVNASTQILVLVHPGNVCGSADFNIGKCEANLAREQLINELRTWRGGVMVIDNELSDELTHYPAFAQAIEDALNRASLSGRLSRRVASGDPNHVHCIRELVQEKPELRRTARFEVIGAWYHRKSGAGSVGLVLKELRALQCASELGIGAIEMDFDIDDVDLELSEEAATTLRQSMSTQSPAAKTATKTRASAKVAKKDSKATEMPKSLKTSKTNKSTKPARRVKAKPCSK